MVSRKRNKGKERRAKKAEQEAKNEEDEITETNFLELMLSLRMCKIWQGWARGEDDKGRQLIPCEHGKFANMLISIGMPDGSDPVAKFMSSLWSGKKNVIEHLRSSFQTHQEVWSNCSTRTAALCILLATGTNMMLSTPMVKCARDAREIAITIAMLDNYDGTGGFDQVLYNRVAAAKIRDLACGGNSVRRDVLKFYRKRISCTCLKKEHLEARKTQPKQGRCFHCQQVKERALLMVCSKCRVPQYCSRECQVAHWPGHKCHCDAFVSTQEQKAKKRCMGKEGSSKDG